MFRTRTQFSEAIKATADLGEQSLAFTEMEMAVLCAIAYHQPIDRAGLADIFGKEVSRDLLARLRARDLIATGPRSPRAGHPIPMSPRRRSWWRLICRRCATCRIGNCWKMRGCQRTSVEFRLAKALRRCPHTNGLIE